MDISEVPFDSEFYIGEYPDLAHFQEPFSAHYRDVGWIEGRSPNPQFDTLDYLERYPDIARARINPFFHYIHFGQSEGRVTVPHVPILERSKTLLRCADLDLVNLIRPYVDVDYYKEQLEYSLPREVDLAAHFTFRGWRIGLDPNRQIRMTDLVDKYPQATKLLVNPLICQVNQENQKDLVQSSEVISPDYVFSIVEKEFNADYYGEEYPDIHLPRERLLSHFCEIGWFEGRNPNPYFDVVSYLEHSPDIVGAKINPFFHYLPYGRYENRNVVPSVTPSARSKLLFGYSVRDWVEALRPEVDLNYYRDQVKDLISDRIDLVAHFAFRGWREGLNPNEQTSIGAFISRYPDAARIFVNPLLAHREAMAGRYVEQNNSSKSSKRYDHVAPVFDGTRKSEGVEPPDDDERQMALVKPEFDADFYKAKNPDVVAAGIDPLSHYFYTGWREFRDPSEWFSTSFYIEEYPDVREAGVNPFLHFIRTGRDEGRQASRGEAQVKVPDEPAREQPEDVDHADRIEIIRTEFSPFFYVEQYPDIASADVDPLLHYYHQGWREGRNPNKSFETDYYLQSNEDVRLAGVNPFWHYLVAGRKEDRPCRRPGGFRRRIIEAAKPPEKRTKGYLITKETALTKFALTRTLSTALQNVNGVVLSLSHDCYIRVVGGTQIFIADEQARFDERQFAYIQLSPRHPMLTLASFDPAFEVQIVVNGVFAGIANFAALISLLQKKRSSIKKSWLLIVHSLMGFEESQVRELYSALRPEHAFYWLHDYSSICEGYNLTRNDLEFCGAPPPDSMVCRICVYGAKRARHLQRFKMLFSYCHFEVLAPSEFALDLWRQNSQLPVVSADAHPHWTLEPKQRVGRAGKAALDTYGPVRIAFIGFPTSAKGWEYFTALVDAYAEDARYKFFHFAARGVPQTSGCVFVVTEVTPQDRQATANLLEEHEIDFLAMLSPWPETFSFVAHEALAAGCQLLCFADSGNVAAAARRFDQGFVFADFSELREFIGAPEFFAATDHARAHRKTYKIIETGTTATVARLFPALVPA